MHRVLLLAAAAVLALTVTHQDLTAQNSPCAGAVCLGSADNRPVYIIQDGTPRASFTTSGLLQLLVGSTTTGRVDTSVTTSTASTCTIADTNETDLWTYTLPAATLNADGRALRVHVALETGATANNKTVQLYVGGTSVTTTGANALNAGMVILDAYVWRTGATAEYVSATNTFGVRGSATQTVKGEGVALAKDTTAAIILKATGTNGTAAANDICAKAAAVSTVY